MNVHWIFGFIGRKMQLYEDALGMRLEYQTRNALLKLPKCRMITKDHRLDGREKPRAWICTPRRADI